MEKLNVEISEITNDMLVVSVCGKVDTTNAEDFFSALEKARGSALDKKFYIDVKGLEYISSAGLRALLALQKNEKEKMNLINVSGSVMSILEVTGFSQILNVSKAFKSISVENCPVIGRGANGTVYRLDEERIVKVYQKEASLVDISRERNLAQKTFVNGIPTAIAYDVVKVNDCLGVVFELLNAKSLSATIVANPDQFDSLAKEYARIYKSFHETKASAGDYPQIKDLYYDYINGCKDWYTEEELNKLRALVDSVPDRDTLIHGDYHARNIMVQNGELLMIDMGDVSIGHPIFDFLATAATQANLVELNPAYAEVHTGMPIEYIKKLWNDLLHLYFADKTEDEIEAIDKQIRIFSKLKVALAPVLGRGAGDEIINGSVMDAKANLLPHIEELIGTVNW